MNFSQRNACATSSSPVFQSEKSSRRRKGFNPVAARSWISLKKRLVTQGVKRHRPGLQRGKGRLLNAADPAAGVFLWGIAVEHRPRVLLQVEMPAQVDATSLVHRVGRVLALAHPHTVRGRQANHQIEWKRISDLWMLDCMNTSNLLLHTTR